MIASLQADAQRAVLDHARSLRTLSANWNHLTCWLQEVRPGAPHTLAAQIARVIAMLALAELGLLGPPFHEPFHAVNTWKATQL